MAEASPYASKPWLGRYTPGLPATFTAAPADALSLFREAAARAPDAPAVLYFDGRIAYRELDAMSDALAAALIEDGFAAGDRLAVFMQNMPQFLIAALAAWKAGGIVVPVNPMYRERELSLILADSEPTALICIDALYDEVVALLPESVARPRILITTAARDLQTRDDPRVFAALRPASPRRAAGPRDLLTILAAFAGRAPARRAEPGPDDIAFLVYTSGTTGVPKAAMNSHGNVAVNGQAIALWYSLREGDPVLGLAPLFHVTGLITHLALPWRLASPVILIHRFEPGVALDAMVEHKPVWTVSAITAFIALMNHKDSSPERYASLRVIVSGGAPIPPSVIEEFRRRTGHFIHNGYGLTETNAGVIAVPHGREVPVDPASGALAIGVPKFNVEAWIAHENGAPAPVGHVGEIVISGPSVARGYWRKPLETAELMRPDGFRTGDVAFMDSEGWFYLVDRKKDVIIASGYKVWPREVEDVLYAHPSVREVAVVGVADFYRGQSVKAFVALKAGARASEAELIDWCRPRMATYKRPQAIEILDELPKTVTGKILRRMLK